MANTESARPRPEPASLPSRLRGRRMLVILAAAVIVAGLALNWSWLTAVGAAPVLLSLAPCALMCGLGLCMKGASGASCSTGGKTAATEPPAAAAAIFEPPAGLSLTEEKRR